ELENDFEDVVGQLVGVDAIHIGEDYDGGIAPRGKSEARAGALLCTSVADQCQMMILGSAPTESVGRRLTVGCLLRGPHRLASLATHELVAEHRDREASHVVGGGNEPSARNLVAGIQDARVLHSGVGVLVIPARAVRNDGEIVVGLRVVHGGGTENVSADVIRKFLGGGTFDDAADDSVAVSGIVEFRAGGGDKRIFGKDGERFPHTGKVTGAVFRNIAFSVRIIVTDPAKMAEKLAGGDRRLLFWKIWTVLLDRRVE